MHRGLVLARTWLSVCNGLGSMCLHVQPLVSVVHASRRTLIGVLAGERAALPPGVERQSADQSTHRACISMPKHCGSRYAPPPLPQRSTNARLHRPAAAQVRHVHLHRRRMWRLRWLVGRARLERRSALRATHTASGPIAPAPSGRPAGPALYRHPDHRLKAPCPPVAAAAGSAALSTTSALFSTTAGRTARSWPSSPAEQSAAHGRCWWHSQAATACHSLPQVHAHHLHLQRHQRRVSQQLYPAGAALQGHQPRCCR